MFETTAKCLVKEDLVLKKLGNFPEIYLIMNQGGELSYIGAPSDDEIFICPDLSDSSSDEEAVNNFHSENSQQNGFKFLQKDYVTKQIFRNIKNFTI